MANELTLDEAKRQIAGLIKENRLQSESVEALDQEVKSLENKTKDAIQAQEKAEVQVKVTQEELQELLKQVAQLQKVNSQLKSQVQRLSKQVEKTPLQPLTPEEGSALLDKTFQAFRNISNFRVTDANITLRLATGKLGDRSVLVFPEPGAVDPASLHELKLNFRSSDLPS